MMSLQQFPAFTFNTDQIFYSKFVWSFSIT